MNKLKRDSTHCWHDNCTRPISANYRLVLDYLTDTINPFEIDECCQRLNETVAVISVSIKRRKTDPNTNNSRIHSYHSSSIDPKKDQIQSIRRWNATILIGSAKIFETKPSHESISYSLRGFLYHFHPISHPFPIESSNWIISWKPDWQETNPISTVITVISNSHPTYQITNHTNSPTNHGNISNIIVVIYIYIYLFIDLFFYR